MHSPIFNGTYGITNLNKKEQKKLLTDKDELLAQILEADYILIGAGAGLSTAAGLTYDGERFKKNFPKFIEKYGMKDMYSFSIK